MRYISAVYSAAAVNGDCVLSYDIFAHCCLSMKCVHFIGVVTPAIVRASAYDSSAIHCPATDVCKSFWLTRFMQQAEIHRGTIICSTHNLTCSEGLLKVSSISGLTNPMTATPLPDRWCNDFVTQFCPFPKKFALQFIDVRESRSVHFLLQNTPNTIVSWI